MTLRNSAFWLIPICFSISLFYYLYGFSVLNPFFMDWMKVGDPSIYLYGFNFLRAEPWHLAFGKIVALHAPFGTSVVYTDSIPLVSILLKIVPGVSPFQFHGAWILLCFILQAAAGYYFIFELTRDRFKSCVGSMLFILFPGFLIRNFETTRHYTLLAHVFVFWTLSNLRFQKSFRSWLTLLLVSLGVHFYFFAFALMAFLASPKFRKKKELGIVVLSSLIAAYFYGYFVIEPHHAVGIGFSEFSMNLLSWFNSEGYALSRLNLPLVTSYQREGFQYLGFGVLFLAGVTLYRAKTKLPKLDRRAYFIYTVGTLAFGLLLSMGPLHLPDWITAPLYILGMAKLLMEIEGWKKTRAIFGAILWFALYLAAGKVLRASGRAGWYLSYALIASLIQIQSSRTVLAAALLLQIIDVAPFLATIRAETQKLVLSTPFGANENRALERFLSGGNTLRLLIIDQNRIAFLEELALQNHLAIGPVYLARSDKADVRANNATERERIVKGRLNSDLIYATDDIELIRSLESQHEVDWIKVNDICFAKVKGRS